MVIIGFSITPTIIAGQLSVSLQGVIFGFWRGSQPHLRPM
jgi:hypothetical protein